MADAIRRNPVELLKEACDGLAPFDHRLVTMITACEEFSYQTDDIKVLRTYLTIARGYLEECLNEAEKRFEEESYNA